MEPEEGPITFPNFHVFAAKVLLKQFSRLGECFAIFRQIAGHKGVGSAVGPAGVESVEGHAATPVA
jgi:hypothetical protein